MKKVDPVMAEVIAAVGKCDLVPRADGTHFDAVMRAIIFQQLSGQAAGTIHRRFKELFGGKDPTPKELLRTSDEKLRAVGLSGQKTRYLKDLATRVESGDFAIDTLDGLSDDGIIEALTAVKGVGRWTAQMFLMFRLGRPDVLPDLDLGIQKGVMRAYRLRKHPPPKRVAKIGAKWAPYRTIASWYLWRLLDTDKPVKIPRSSTS
ncbi:MAG: DNA-3-methyladenine glycosylase [Gemmatimonadota bacterium]|nr:DNA-3-methyladenine glycosylase [Gemmatimonadota bacterium]